MERDCPHCGCAGKNTGADLNSECLFMYFKCKNPDCPCGSFTVLYREDEIFEINYPEGVPDDD